MAWYNLTGVDATNILTFTQGINSQFMQNDLGNIILIMIFFISFIGFSLYNDNEPIQNLTASSSIVAVLSIPLSLLSLVPEFTPFLCWGIFALNLTILILSK